MSIEEQWEKKRIDQHRADYVITKYLDTFDEETGYKELIVGITSVVDELKKEELSPIHYTDATSKGDINSKSFFQALGRCRSSNKIDEDRNGFYYITEYGEQYLNDVERLKRYGVNEEFREAVDTSLQRIN